MKQSEAGAKRAKQANHAKRAKHVIGAFDLLL